MTRLIAAMAACLLLGSAPASAQQRFALVVSGASGGESYAAQYREWTESFARVLSDRLAFDPANVTVLSDASEPDASATAANVRKAIAGVRQRMRAQDLLFILLIGHGTYDGVDAKFNLVGPDLESAEWLSLLDPLPGRVALVNTSPGSFPFIERLSGPRRIIITATDSVAQRFDTVFVNYFIRSFADETADLDRNGRISIWEAFSAGTAGVRRHYQQLGQLATERALLDDNGDRIGSSAAEQGEDGAQASRTYLQEAAPDAPPTDEALVKLLQRKAVLEAELEELKIRRKFLSAEEYAREFERIITEYARVSSEIRRRT